MSEKITHTAIVDDALRLTIGAGLLCRAGVEAVQGNWDLARLGSATRAADRHSVGLLQDLRSRWRDGQADPVLQARLAFVLGWLCHRAADRQMKPVFRALEPASPLDPTECSVYHDATVFREVYGTGANGPFSEATFRRDLAPLPAASLVDAAAVRDLIHTLLQQSLVELHTLDPDEGNIESWIDGLGALQQRFYVDVDRYARAIAEPDPDKVRRYIVGPCFYVRTEPIISTARSLQHGDTMAPSEVRGALRATPESQYGHALRKACGYLVAASEFLQGTVEAEDLRRRLDIGAAGSDGKAV